MNKLLIQGGAVVDGSGSPCFRADVAIDGDRIVAVGAQLDKTGRTVIDAEGLVVAPGFIDIHTHSDRTILNNPLGDSKILQGVTTEVTCNCGIGPFPVGSSSRRQEELAAYLQAQDGSLPAGGITWKDFAGFAERVERVYPGINLAMLVPHGALRIAAMGSDDRPPSRQELQAMEEMLDECLRQGAWGLSTGLIYPPGSFARTDELIALAKILKRHGALYSSHIRGESVTLLKAAEEVISIARESGVRALNSHLKAIGKPYWGNGYTVLQRIEAARKQGIDIWADQYPYEATATSLSALVPGWGHDGGIEKLVARLKDPALAAKLNQAIKQEMDTRGGPERVKISFVGSQNGRRWVGKSIAEVALARSLSPEDAVRQLLAEENTTVGAIYFSLSDRDLESIMQSPDVAVGSDGQVMNASLDAQKRVHPRSYGTFPRVLGVYVRQKKLLPLERAIRKMTGLPAFLLGIPDRGQIKPGYQADITLFDPEKVIDKADFDNPHQYPAGIPYVLVNGTLAVNQSALTGNGRGEVLRRKP